MPPPSCVPVVDAAATITIGRLVRTLLFLFRFEGADARSLEERRGIAALLQQGRRLLRGHRLMHGSRIEPWGQTVASALARGPGRRYLVDAVATQPGLRSKWH